MDTLFIVMRFIVFELLGQAAILVGLMSCVGLALQKKPATTVIGGTIKTIVGFLIFGIGAGAAVFALDNFQTLFATGFGLTGVLPLAEAVTGLAQQQFGTVIALIMVFGFIVNLIVARITPFKYIFLTGQHNLFLAALLTVSLKAVGLSSFLAVIVGSMILGFAGAIYPAIAQPFFRKVIGNDEFAMGHYCTLTYALSGWLGSKVGDAQRSTERLKLPGWLGIFRDYVVSIALSITIFYYISAFVAGREAVESAAGGTHWLVFPLIQALTFAGAVYVIITGVRMLLGEIVPAFVGISEKFIPDARPALDCPVSFPYAPTATVVGFLSAYVGGLVCMGIFSVIGAPVIIPVAIPYFFIGATSGVFGNATGGWKGAVVGGFVTGIVIAVGPALLFPVMAQMGLEGSSFPEPDFVVLGLAIWYIGRLFGGAS